MSSDDRESYSRRYRSVSESLGTDEGRTARAERVKTAREEVSAKAALPRPVRNTKKLYDHGLVKNSITRPKPGVDEIHVVLVDNSGSNEAIARHLRDSSGYLTTGLNAIDPSSQMASIYFSDHKDGDRLMQEVDFISPDAEGEKILLSTLTHVDGANGHDRAEAIECALVRACEINFGSATKRHLYLVTDVVGHGMGMDSDNGCPHQVDWKKSVEKVRKTYTSFVVIGCGDDSEVVDLQKQFLLPDRVALDLIDLSSIRELKHRQAITGNALLFLMARHSGVQSIQMFLSALYEKWLSEPIFGRDTDRRAKEMIQRFLKYIDLPADKLEKMASEILVDK